MSVILIIIGTILFISLGTSGIVSILEKEARAVRVSFTLALILSLPYLVIGFTEFSGKSVAAVILLIPPIVFIILFFIRLPFPVLSQRTLPESRRFDERDISFSRYRLKPDTPRYDDYYNRNPDRRSGDDAIRSRPGLLSRDSVLHHEVSFAATIATFHTVGCLNSHVTGPVSKTQKPIEPAAMSRFLKTWAVTLGAMDAGITPLKDYHLYTVKGRGNDYGNPVVNTHSYALAFSVEMRKELLDAAPKGATVMESAQQYLNSGTIAVQVASFIREMGYSARAHIDGSYQVICPVIARDAGLGDIGRMTLLMNSKVGPRMRISVVTTDMPLVPDSPIHDDTMLDFCRHCKKCAVCCPSQALPDGDIQEIEGVKRWKLDDDACFRYWCSVGTDCGRCMSVCPFSHPNNLFHNVVRWCISFSPFFRRIAAPLDDLFYGRKKPPAKMPDWIP